VADTGSFGTAALARNVSSIAEELREIAAEVAALPEEYARRLLPILREGQLEAEKGLRRWLATVEDGGERFGAQRYRAAMLHMRASLAAIERRLAGGMHEVLMSADGAAAFLAGHHVARELVLFHGAFGAMPRPDLGKAAVMAHAGRAVIFRHEASARRYGRAVTSDIRRQLALGMVQGETFDQMTNRLVRLGGPRGLVSLGGGVVESIAEGLFRRYRHWAERVVRTECIDSYNAHALESIRAEDEVDPGYLKRWDAANDHRVCEVCDALDGEIRALNEDFTGGISHPTVHPRDRCCITPYRREWPTDEVLGEGGLGGGSDSGAPTEPRQPTVPPTLHTPDLHAPGAS
jgi:SPP1 gp7 family putative phage head morphogenesis protein